MRSTSAPLPAKKPATPCAFQIPDTVPPIVALPLATISRMRTTSSGDVAVLEMPGAETKGKPTRR